MVSGVCPQCGRELRGHIIWSWEEFMEDPRFMTPSADLDDADAVFVVCYSCGYKRELVGEEREEQREFWNAAVRRSILFRRFGRVSEWIE